MPRGFVSLKKHREVVRLLNIDKAFIQKALDEEKSKGVMSPRELTADELKTQLWNKHKELVEVEHQNEKKAEVLEVIRRIIDIGRM